MTAYPEFLIARRASLRITQADLARMMEIRQPDVARVENFHAPVSADFVIIAARALRDDPLEHLITAGFLTRAEVHITCQHWIDKPAMHAASDAQ